MADVKSFLDNIVAPRNKIIGVTPSVLLVNPKYGHNVGAAIRAAACYGFEQVWYTGHRIDDELEERKRLPREERMKGYASVSLHQSDYPFDSFPSTCVPIAVEVDPTSISLPQFDHPESALYVFGPEDGSIPSVVARHCHMRVIIPTNHCLNLATAVATVLYDRKMKRQLNGIEPYQASYDVLKEQRGEAVNDMEFLA